MANGTGVFISGVNNRIGTDGNGVADAAERNIISGNNKEGLTTSGILVAGNVIAGNFIGIDVTGTQALGNRFGVIIRTGLLGTNGDGVNDAAERNIISGNHRGGVFTVQADAVPVPTIAGNYIGTDITGLVGLGNGEDGIVTETAVHIESNVIGSNADSGVHLTTGSTTGTVIVRNSVGTDSTGTVALGNAVDGILVEGFPQDVTIGGTPLDGNIIAFNGGSGIAIDSGSRHAIRANSVFANAGLGIDLAPFGVTLNDVGDADVGANGRQNFPIITSATSDGIDTTIDGTINSLATSTFAIEVFGNAASDPSGHGEGETFLGTAASLTNASGDGSWSLVVPGDFTGVFVTATATDATGNTSEFSASAVVQVAAGDVTPPVVVPDIAGTLGNSGWYVSDVTVSWTVTDPESLIDSTTGCDTVVLTTDTAGATYTCEATSEGGTTSESVTVKRDATAPEVTATPSPAPNANGWSNSDVTVTFTCTDTLSGVVTVDLPQTLTSEGAGQSATGGCTDRAGNSDDDTASGINIDKTNPVVTVTSPLDFAVEEVGLVLSLGATDALSGVDSVVAILDDGSTSSTVTSGFVVNQPGIYDLTVTATDFAGNEATETRRFVVYDPAGGFATGGGWIIPGTPGNSDPGDVLPGLDGTSKATFGFVVKYKNGASTDPQGNLEFVYHVGEFVLNTTDYEWLVVTNNNWARFQGVATINGGTDLYPFRVESRDGDTNLADRFIIKIWAPGDDPDVDELLYKASGDLGGGQIKIHN